MSMRHSNPTLPRKERKGRSVWARAPYNFVSLPTKIVPAEAPLPLDRYFPEPKAYSGWFECILETQSPTYVRGMLSQAQFEKFGEKGSDELSEDEKEAMATFYSKEGSSWRDKPKPAIPGSSLRGMVRSIVEVVSFSYIRWVAAVPKFTFRAVAASKDDPLREPYESVLGRFGSKVNAGYLVKEGENWFIRPARRPADLSMAEKGAYLKVKERNIQSSSIPGFKLLNQDNYAPGYYEVSFETENRRGKRGSYTAITALGTPQSKHSYRGVLVCSGNMLETESDTASRRDSPRKNHALLLEPDTNRPLVRIPRQMIVDYSDGLTPFQKELKAWGGNSGVLKPGAPVFYVTDHDGVLGFGHSPNFRVPAQLQTEKRAASPRDFIPAALQRSKDNPLLDFTDTIFGWVEDEFHPREQCAGRVSFRDAELCANQTDIWYKEQPIVPHVMGAPKATTFQHYLVQSGEHGHDPDNKALLANYTSPQPETQIRGQKFYWIKGQQPDIEASVKELKKPKQLTRIMPLKPGVKFKFRIQFENLRDYELGALCWVLNLPQQHSHRLGMGKPFGMGVVSLAADLNLIQRQERYQLLFAADQEWFTGARQVDSSAYQSAFCEYVLARIDPADNPQNVPELENLPRIQEMLLMLQWRDGDPAWVEWTRYMEIEHGPRGDLDEYTERPVLPDPGGVIALFSGHPPEKSSADRLPEDARPTAKKIEKVVSSVEDLQPGYRLRATIDFIEDNGDIYLALENIPGSQVLGRIRAARRGDHEYTSDASLVVEVLGLVEEHKEQIAELQPVTTGTPSTERSDVETGTVKVYGLAGKNYGFILPDSGGKDVFVHQSQLRGVITLHAGQRVRYLLVKGKKGKLAANDVEVIE